MYKEIIKLVMPNFEVTKIYERENTIYKYLWIDTTTGYFELPLSELGRLCKEWCFNYYYVGSVMIGTTSYRFDLTEKTRHDCPDINNFYGNTELEAIIKATEWVAKKKGLLDAN